MAAGDYCTIDDVLLFVSPNSQARLTTEPGRPWRIGVGPSHPVTTWDTPYIGATTLTGYFNGALQANTTLLVGTGAGGTDQITFACPPLPGVVVTVVADSEAINSVIVDRAITAASREIDRYISGRYKTPVTNATLLAQLRDVATEGVKWILRRRRDLEEWNPIVEQRKAILRWLEMVAKGQIPLVATAEEATVTLPETPAYSQSEESVFDPPLSGTNASLYGI